MIEKQRATRQTGIGSESMNRRGRLLRAYLSGEAVWALLLVLVGTTGLIAALTMHAGQAHDPLGGRFFPVAISVSLMAAATTQLLKPLVRVLLGQAPTMGEDPGAASGVRAEVDPEETLEGPLGKPLVRVVAMATVSITYVALLDFVGYIPATILAMAGALWILQTRGWRGLLVGPIVMAFSVYYIFTTFLFVRLP